MIFNSINKPIHELTLPDIQKLRYLPVADFNAAYTYDDVENMHSHLSVLFDGRVYRSFTEKLISRYNTYCKTARSQCCDTTKETLK